MDFNIYLDAVKVLFSGGNPYTHLINSPGPHNYPPTAFLFLIFLQNKLLFDILSFLSFFISLYLLTNKKFFVSCLLFLVSYAIFFPFKFNYGMGQINNFILLFCVLAYYYSPVFLAYAIGIKVIPAIYLLYFFIKRDFKKIFATLVFLFFFFLLSFLIISWDFQKIYFFDVFFRGFGNVGKEVYYNQSLAGLLARSSLSFFIYPFSLLILFMTWLKGRKINSPRLFSAVTCLLLILSPIAWQHHFVFAIIPLILLFPLNKLLVIVAYFLIASNIKNPRIIPGEFSFILSHQFWGIFILWILALWDKKAVKIISYIWIF